MKKEVQGNIRYLEPLICYTASELKLLQLNLSAGSLELLLDLVRLSLRSSLLDGLRSGVNLLLRFLQAQAGDLADNLDNVDLGGTSLNQNNVEIGLCIGSRSAVSSTAAMIFMRGSILWMKEWPGKY